MGKKEEKFNDYDGFVEKFKPKKTTDDCYTPPYVYDAVLDWVKRNADIEGRPVVRPFWPGSDYTKTEYPDGCVVVDNPPFSIRSQILRYYEERNIHYFLFSPHLTLLTGSRGCRTSIVTNSRITYENGAAIPTDFITNLPDFSDYCVIGCPELKQVIEEAQSKRREEEKKKKNKLPTYNYPDHLVTVSDVARLVDAGLGLRIPAESAVFVCRLDAQRSLGKTVFGGGLLVSDAMAEKMKAGKMKAEKMKQVFRFELSETERGIVEKLNENERRHQ